VASVTTRKMSSGNWRAVVRHGTRKSICKTWPTKAAADRWGHDLAAQIEAGAEPEQAAVTVGALVDAYRKLRDAVRPISDSSNEHYQLKTLARLLGDVDATRLATDDLVAFCTQRRDEGAGPYTLNMDVSKLSTVLRYSAAAKGLLLPDSVGMARPLLSHMGLIGGGGRRERRPTVDELDRVVAYMREHHGDVWADAVLFAVASAMRRGEICKLLWTDIDEVKRLALVRDRKDPRKKAGNDQWVPLLPAAWTLVQRQPRTAERVFPVGDSALSKYFTWACRELGIPDLHLHDMRHEGTSRLFEEGYEIPQVALVTGHKKWENLRRYTQLKPEGLHRE